MRGFKCHNSKEEKRLNTMDMASRAGDGVFQELYVQGEETSDESPFPQARHSLVN